MMAVGWRAVRAAVAASAVLLLAGVAVARQGEVVARGNLLGAFEAYEVTRVRVMGVELYVDFSADIGDVLTAAALSFIAVVLLVAARRLSGPVRGAFVDGGCGALFLAADDLLSAHETLGHNLPALVRIPLVDHPDDAVLAVYAVVVAVFLWRHRPLRSGTAPGHWLTAGAAAVLAVAHDVSPLHLRMLEESLEVLAAGAASVGVLALVRHHVRDASVSRANPIPARSGRWRTASPSGTGSAARSTKDAPRMEGGLPGVVVSDSGSRSPAAAGPAGSRPGSQPDRSGR
jgi:hypothetical protein